MAKQQFLDLEGVRQLLSGIRGETATVVKNAYSQGLRVKLMSEVNTAEQSAEGCIYIDASNVESPMFKIGDGKAYIVDLPVWDIGGITTVLDTLKQKSITADIAEETLLLPYIFENEKG